MLTDLDSFVQVLNYYHLYIIIFNDINFSIILGILLGPAQFTGIQLNLLGAVFMVWGTPETTLYKCNKIAQDILQDIKPIFH